jgi:hypothetical protein
MSKAVTMAGWDDVPHLTQAERQRLLAATPPHLREARSRGIPSLGSGAIYPIALDDVVVDDFPLPRHWPRGYGMDVGWKATAQLCGAWDRDGDVIYAYREYRRGQAEPAIHAAAIKAAGAELIGAIDPAARGRSQRDGKQLIADYEELGLRLVPAKNAVEAGLFTVWERLSTGRLKLFRSLVQTAAEFRLYRRDERGAVVKENDHLMDCLRYLVATKDDVMIWQGEPQPDSQRRSRAAGEGAWMQY